MENKKYSSYAQIEADLEILKVERQLKLQKIFLGVQKTKESMNPLQVAKRFFGDYKSVLFNHSGTIFKFLLPLFFNWLFKRKRGD
jgi:hypothetical protein